MLTATIAFAISALSGAVLTPIVRDWARRRGLLDHARSSRKIHAAPVPRLGGVAIVIAFFLPLAGLLFVKSSVGELFRAELLDVVGLFAGGLAVAALGIYDDLKGANARQKLSVQVAVGLFMYACDYRLDQIAIPFGQTVDLGMLGLPVTLLWFVGIINAMNLIDGLDGLAGGVAFTGISCTFILAVLRQDPLHMLLSATLAGAVLGFLLYNFNPASVFMGDTGSMFLGFVLASSAIQTTQQSSTAVALLAPVVALGLPIGDTFLAIFRRVLRGRSVFQADREHIHHLLLAKGWSARRTCVALYLVSAVLAACAVALSYAASGWTAVLVILPLLAGTAVFLRWLGYAHLERMPEVVETRRRNLEMRAAVKAAGEELRRSRHPLEIWEAVRGTGPALGARSIGLTLVEKGSRGRKLTEYSHGTAAVGEGAQRARFVVTPERIAEASIELSFDGGSPALDRDTEIAIEALSSHLASAIERLEIPLAGEMMASEPAKVIALRRMA